MTARERVIRILKQGLTDLARLKSADRLLQIEYIPIVDPLYTHRRVQGFLQQYKTSLAWPIAAAQIVQTFGISAVASDWLGDCMDPL